MDRIGIQDRVRRARRRTERVGRGARGTSAVAGSELRNYPELARSRPEAMASFEQVPRGAFAGWNSFGFNTTQFNSTPSGGEPPLTVIQYSPLGLGFGVLGESFGLKG